MTFPSPLEEYARRFGQVDPEFNRGFEAVLPPTPTRAPDVSEFDRVLNEQEAKRSPSLFPGVGEGEVDKVQTTLDFIRSNPGLDEEQFQQQARLYGQQAFGEGAADNFAYTADRMRDALNLVYRGGEGRSLLRYASASPEQKKELLSLADLLVQRKQAGLDSDIKSQSNFMDRFTRGTARVGLNVATIAEALAPEGLQSDTPDFLSKILDAQSVIDKDSQTFEFARESSNIGVQGLEDILNIGARGAKSFTEQAPNLLLSSVLTGSLGTTKLGPLSADTGSSLFWAAQSQADLMRDLTDAGMSRGAAALFAAPFSLLSGASESMFGQGRIARAISGNIDRAFSRQVLGKLGSGLATGGKEYAIQIGQEYFQGWVEGIGRELGVTSQTGEEFSWSGVAANALAQAKEAAITMPWMLLPGAAMGRINRIRVRKQLRSLSPAEFIAVVAQDGNAQYLLDNPQILEDAQELSNSKFVRDLAGDVLSAEDVRAVQQTLLETREVLKEQVPELERLYTNDLATYGRNKLQVFGETYGADRLANLKDALAKMQFGMPRTDPRVFEFLNSVSMEKLNRIANTPGEKIRVSDIMFSSEKLAKFRDAVDFVEETHGTRAADRATVLLAAQRVTPEQLIEMSTVEREVLLVKSSLNPDEFIIQREVAPGISIPSLDVDRLMQVKRQRERTDILQEAGKAQARMEPQTQTIEEAKPGPVEEAKPTTAPVRRLRLKAPPPPQPQVVKEAEAAPLREEGADLNVRRRRITKRWAKFEKTLESTKAMENAAFRGDNEELLNEVLGAFETQNAGLLDEKLNILEKKIRNYQRREGKKAQKAQAAVKTLAKEVASRIAYKDGETELTVVETEGGDFVIRGAEDIAVKVVPEIAGGYAAWDPKNKVIRIAQSTVANKDGLPQITHEMLHAMRDLGLINDREWTRLSNLAKRTLDQSTQDSIFNNLRKRNIIDEVGKDEFDSLNHELVAKMMERWKVDGPAKLHGKIWAKVKEFAQGILDAVAQGQKLTADEKALLDRIARGEPLRKKTLPKKTPKSTTRKSATLQTETPAFKKWFGDSKVVDAKGNPLVVYHGTGHGRFGERASRKENLRRAKADVRELRQVLALELKDALPETRLTREGRVSVYRTQEAIDARWPSVSLSQQNGISRSDRIANRVDAYESLLGKVTAAARTEIENQVDEEISRDAEAQAEFDKERRAKQKLLDDYRSQYSSLSESDFEAGMPIRAEGLEAFVTRSGGNTDQGYLASGAYFTADKALADSYAKFGTRTDTAHVPYTYSVYLSLQNPYVAGENVEIDKKVNDFVKEYWDREARHAKGDLDRLEGIRSSALRLALETFGFDGQIGNYGEGIEYVAFRPEQIKSATENTGAFDPKNPDIRYSAKLDLPVTTDLENAGFIGADGQALQVFTGGSRSTGDHSTATGGRVREVIGSGYIRVAPGDRSLPTAEMYQNPTSQQIKTLDRWARSFSEGFVSLELEKDGEHQAIIAPRKEMIGTIRDFFSGRQRRESNLSRFRLSADLESETNDFSEESNEGRMPADAAEMLRVAADVWEKLPAKDRDRANWTSMFQTKTGMAKAIADRVWAAVIVEPGKSKDALLRSLTRRLQPLFDNPTREATRNAKARMQAVKKASAETASKIKKEQLRNAERLAGLMDREVRSMRQLIQLVQREARIEGKEAEQAKVDIFGAVTRVMQRMRDRASSPKRHRDNVLQLRTELNALEGTDLEMTLPALLGEQQLGKKRKKGFLGKSLYSNIMAALDNDVTKTYELLQNAVERETNSLFRQEFRRLFGAGEGDAGKLRKMLKGATAEQRADIEAILRDAGAVDLTAEDLKMSNVETLVSEGIEIEDNLKNRIKEAKARLRQKSDQHIANELDSMKRNNIMKPLKGADKATRGLEPHILRRWDRGPQTVTDDLENVGLLGSSDMVQTSNKAQITDEEVVTELWEDGLAELGVDEKRMGEMRELDETVVEAPDGTTETVTHTGMQRVQLRAYLRGTDVDARAKVLANEIRFDHNRDARSKFTGAQIARQILDSVPAEQAELEERMADLILTILPGYAANQGNTAAERVLGRRVFSDEVGMTTLMNAVVGDIDKGADAEIGNMLEGKFEGREYQTGVVKGRVKHGSPVVIQDADELFRRYARRLTTFANWAETYKIYSDTLANPEIKEVLVKNLGERSTRDAREFVKALTHQVNTDQGAFGRAVGKVASFAAQKQLAFGVTSTARNRIGGSIGYASQLLVEGMDKVAKLYGKHAIRGMRNILKNPFKLSASYLRDMNKMQESSKYMKRRWGESASRRMVGQLDYQIPDQGLLASDKFKKAKTAYNKLVDASFKMLVVAEQRNAVELFRAFKEAGRTDEDAVAEVERLTRRTQNPSTLLDSPKAYIAIQKNPALRLMFPFLGQPAVIARNFRKNMNDAKRGIAMAEQALAEAETPAERAAAQVQLANAQSVGGKTSRNAMIALGGVVAFDFLFSLAMQIARKSLDDRTKRKEVLKARERYESWLSEFGYYFGDAFNSYLPGGGEVVQVISALADTMNGVPRDPARDLGAGLVGGMIRDMSQVAKVGSRELKGKNTNWRDWYDAGSKLTRSALPVKGFFQAPEILFGAGFAADDFLEYLSEDERKDLQNSTDYLLY